MSDRVRRYPIDPPVEAGSCRWCGKTLVAIAQRYHGVSIKGVNDYEYAHEDGTTECVIKRTPGPYDAWAATRIVERKLLSGSRP
jgi:hypothetical protein